MSSGDLWFLLIFIILPTAVLVSGFWAFLFVRRDPRKTIPQRRQQASEVKSTRDDVQETVQVATIPPPARAESVPVAGVAAAEVEDVPEPDAPLPGPTAGELAGDTDDATARADEPDDVESKPEGELQGPDPVDLPTDEPDTDASQPAAQTVDDERLIELVDVDDRDELIAEIERRQVAQPARLESSTDEIPDLGEALIEPARLSEAGQHDEWRPRETAEPATSESTGPEIDESELAGETEPEPQSDAGDDDQPAKRDEKPSADGDNPRRYRRRRPRVKLLPSDNGERQERRGRLAGRRRPGQERPSGRDKGGM